MVGISAFWSYSHNTWLAMLSFFVLKQNHEKIFVIHILWHHMASQILFDFVSGNGLVAWQHQGMTSIHYLKQFGLWINQLLSLFNWYVFTGNAQDTCINHQNEMEHYMQKIRAISPQTHLSGANDEYLDRINIRGPFFYIGLISIPAWISNHISSKVWYEITYPFPNFNGCTVEVWKWVSNFIPHFMKDVIIYQCWD